MSNRFLFTVKAIDALPLPEKDRVEYFDTKEASLQLRVSKTGVKTFRWFRHIKGEGRPDPITIGRIGDIGIETARRKCAEYNNMMVMGINPNIKKRLLKAEITFDELFEKYLQEWSKPYKKSWKDDEWRYKKWIKPSPIAKRKLSQIHTSHIVELHMRCGIQYPGAANRTLALISAVFSKGKQWGYCKENPAFGIERFKEKSRERFIEGEELCKFFEAVNGLSNPDARDFFLMALYTAARRGNVAQMKWEDLRLDQREWLIPDTKNGTSHRVPLVPEAIEILNERKKNKINEYVFPSKLHKDSYIKSFSWFWSKIKEDMGVTNLRIHDLRRTMGSWMTITGASLTVVGKGLNHKSVQATQVYARLHLDPVRQSMEKAVEAMLNFKNKSNS